MNSIAVGLAMQFAGRGRLEGHPPGDVDGARFEGRFVIFSMTGDKGPVFGEDVSLFDPECVTRCGRGPQSAHFVAVRSGYGLEGFETGDADFIGHTIGRTSSNTRLRVYFDPQPNGPRNFEDRASFMKGELVATYKAEEFFQIDPRGGVFDTRVNYTILESKPFTYLGYTVDLGELPPGWRSCPTATTSSLTRNPSPSPTRSRSPTAAPASSPTASRSVERCSR